MSDDIDADLRRVLRDIYEQRDTSNNRIGRLETTLGQLLDILEGREVITDGHRRLLEKLANRRPAETSVELGTPIDKYAADGGDIDCASLLHLCHARCCSFKVALTTQDLDEGELLWDYAAPYLLPRVADGYCSYLRSDGGCRCYDMRPATCRTYDCRLDKRVWTDWENKVPAPLPSHLVARPQMAPGEPDE